MAEPAAFATLFPGLAAEDIALPQVVLKPEAGGLDVVIERTQPVDAPLVLSSRRLDEAATPARPPAPGAIWEVIIAQHHEQTLAERNQTLSRQLAFRQIAFTLLRRFSYASWYYWVRTFTQRNGGELPVRLVEDEYPPIPDRYPDQPDHLNFDAALDPDDARSLDLPERVGNFSQGVLALQWRALPFYYEHSLLVIAQTDSTVSPINSVTQRDLTYQSPLPFASASGSSIEWRRLPPFPADIPADAPIKADTRIRDITIPLRRLWDSLPAEAQQQWSGERPDPVDGTATARKLSALPDPEVVYQIVELFSGNIEVQAECFYDPVAEKFTHRQLGKHFLVTGTLLRPQSGALGDFPLHVLLLQVSEEQLSGDFDIANLPIDTRNRLAIAADGRFLFAGVMTKDDLRALVGLLNEQDGNKIRQLYKSWYSTEPVSVALPDQLGQLGSVIDFVASTALHLVWEGPSDADAAALQQLPGDSAFTAAIAQLVARAAGAAGETFTKVEIPVAPRAGSASPSAAGLASARRGGNPLHRARLAGRADRGGCGGAAELGAVSEFAQAVEALIAAVRNFALSFDLPPEPRRPTEAQLPAELQPVLHIQPAALVYEGPKADAAQMAALQSLTTQGDQPFQQAVAAIIAANRLLLRAPASSNRSSFRPRACGPQTKRCRKAFRASSPSSRSS